jgi:hypothetical protein
MHISFFLGTYLSEITGSYESRFFAVFKSEGFCVYMCVLELLFSSLQMAIVEIFGL